MEIRGILQKKNKHIVEPSPCKYNNKLYIDSCSICNKNLNLTELDTHHIIYQEDFDENDTKDHYKKNDINNLVVLCEEHHKAVHDNKLKIYGYSKTINGKRKLKYEFLEKKEKKKLKYDYIKDIITKKYKDDYIKNILKIKYIRNEVNKTYNINMSEHILKKILDENY